MIMVVVQMKSMTPRDLDGWGWRDLKAHLVSFYDNLADMLRLVEEDGRWPDGLLDAYIAARGLWCVGYGSPYGWVTLRSGFVLACLTQSTVLEDGAA